MLFSQKDKKIMSLALNEAREAGKQGNFPIFYKNRWPEIRSGLFAKESYYLLLSFFASKDTQEFREMFNTYKDLKI